MRDMERFDKVYAELAEIHKKYFPDMRLGQFLLNGLGWIQSVKKVDPFFPECEEIVKLFKEYAKCRSIWYHGWDVLNTNSDENK
jgi:hypothetical protein